jgi:hypothetical protein
MAFIDEAVLNATERMCQALQRWYGRTNVWLAFQLTNLSIILYFVWMADLFLLTKDRAFRAFVALFSGILFFALTRTIFKTSIEASEIEAYRRVAKGLRNPRRIRDAQLRIGFLTLTILLSFPLSVAYATLHLRFVLMIQVLIVLTTVVLYVLGCDPLPPCTGTVRAWLRGLVPSRKVEAETATSRRDRGESPFADSKAA